MTHTTRDTELLLRRAHTSNQWHNEVMDTIGFYAFWDILWLLLRDNHGVPVPVPGRLGGVEWSVNGQAPTSSRLRVTVGDCGEDIFWVRGGSGIISFQISKEQGFDLLVRSGVGLRFIRERSKAGVDVFSGLNRRESSALSKRLKDVERYP